MASPVLPRWRNMKAINRSLIRNLHFSFMALQLSTTSIVAGGGGGGGGQADAPLYSDVPKTRRSKLERKPYPTPMKVLIRRAKEEKKMRKVNPCRVLEHPPENGLLVPELIDVAHQVYRARESLLLGISKLVRLVPVLRCRFCFEVHIGPVGHQIHTCTGPKSGFRRAMHVWRRGHVQDVIYFPSCYHLYDRVGKPRVVHNERSSIQRIPAIVELCVQAGVHLEKYPVRRRTKPVYSVQGRILGFEPEADLSGLENDLQPSSFTLQFGSECKAEARSDQNSEENTAQSSVEINPGDEERLKDLGIRMLESWFEMISGAKKMMEKYTVWTCGYCPEVQVGPKGHKVRMCKASKHQSRDGMHAWQEATIDDIVGPNYVWHVQDPHGAPLDNNLKRYYGKSPALVELCVQAGAPVPHIYSSMMRLDVVPPDRDEVDLVA
ncbi:hypothetical protein Dimus_036882 [Dionaea muscipula]